MAYKGTIPAGSVVEISLEMEPDASGPASVTASFSAGDTAESEGVVVAPGAADGVSLHPDAKGMLQIFVDMASEGDRGTLSVTSDGRDESHGQLDGDAVWTFAVIP